MMEANLAIAMLIKKISNWKYFQSLDETFHEVLPLRTLISKH